MRPGAWSARRAVTSTSARGPTRSTGSGSGASAGIGGFQKALDFGVQPGFSVDNETSYSTDMFGEMRAAFFIQRALATNRRANKDPDPRRR